MPIKVEDKLWIQKLDIQEVK